MLFTLKAFGCRNMDKRHPGTLKGEVMKKLILACALLLLTSFTYGQDLKKGVLVGIHTWDVKLAPGVTIEQYLSAYYSKVTPVAEKAYPGWKSYPIKRVRGDKSPTYGLMIIVPSEKERSKYYKADDTYTELGKASSQKIAEAEKELSKLGSILTDHYIDWLVY